MDELTIILVAKLCISMALLVLQILTIRLFLAYPEFRDAVCFRIMLVISLCDSCILFIAGPLPILVYMYDFFAVFPWMEKISGALLNTASSLVFLLNLMLAINRLCMVIKLYILFDFSEGERRWEKMVNGILTFLTIVFFIVYTALFCTPKLDMHLYRDDFSWANNGSAPWAKTFSKVDNQLINNCSPLVTMLLYFAIFGIMKWYKGDFSNATTAANVNVKQTQRRILLQSAVQFVVILQVPVIGFLSNFDIGLSIVERYNIMAIMINLVCGINPVIYLAILPNFRQKFVADFLMPVFRGFSRKNGQTEVIVVKPNSNFSASVKSADLNKC